MLCWVFVRPPKLRLTGRIQDNKYGQQHTEWAPAFAFACPPSTIARSIVGMFGQPACFLPGKSPGHPLVLLPL
ncbi:hypothetical protein FRC12_001564 [Ceratobasidium sp. 428]|nr:hypothetical protein FRC12_001564 [Ceratobasidium sp. 428]